MPPRRAELEGARVTVMGLGLHGGGIATSRFLAACGARVLVTDMKTSAQLAPALAELDDLDLAYRLGEHREADFTDTDLVVKNPGVRPTSPYLAAARRTGTQITTDIALFLAFSPAPLIAVTGSKGKSTTASAIHAGLVATHPGARLGGNITVSPLTFLDELTSRTPVVLELSSWQLADLAEHSLPRPQVAVVTNLLADHRDAYDSPADYARDKQGITRYQGAGDILVLNADDPVVRRFAEGSAAAVRLFGVIPAPQRDGAAATAADGPSDARLTAGDRRGSRAQTTARKAELTAWLDGDEGWVKEPDTGRPVRLFGASIGVHGQHSRLNLLAAGLALACFGDRPEDFAPALEEFGGIPHRIEVIGERHGVVYINDSAATIPEATVAAVSAISTPIVLICGGTDKRLDLAPLVALVTGTDGVGAGITRLVLLAGSATARLQEELDGHGVAYAGPFDSMQAAVASAQDAAKPGSTVLLSPGAASFELFDNEFDRGDQFRHLVEAGKPPIGPR